jgi:hypothetical protein
MDTAPLPFLLWLNKLGMYPHPVPCCLLPPIRILSLHIVALLGDQAHTASQPIEILQTEEVSTCAILTNIEIRAEFGSLRKS